MSPRGFVLSLMLTMASSLFSAGQIGALDIRTGIEPPADQIKIISLSAKGEQIYVSQASAGSPVKFDWVLLEPKADLFDAAGRRVGRHVKGPIWDVTRCKVTGRKLKSQPSAGIPWLLLEVVKYEGAPDGLLSTTAFIQRVNTSGGQPPSEPALAAGVRRAVRYSADYVFWGRAEPASLIRSRNAVIQHAISELRAGGEGRRKRRTEAMEALRRIGPEARTAVPILVQELGSANVTDIREAIKTLGSIGPDAREAIPRLRGFLADRREDALSVRHEAAAALEKIAMKADLP